MSASLRVQPPPEPLKVIGQAKVLPFEVMVLPVDVALNDVVPECDQVIPEPTVKFPYMSKPYVPANVPVNPVMVRLLA